MSATEVSIHIYTFSFFFPLKSRPTDPLQLRFVEQCHKFVCHQTAPFPSHHKHLKGTETASLRHHLSTLHVGRHTHTHTLTQTRIELHKWQKLNRVVVMGVKCTVASPRSSTVSASCCQSGLWKKWILYKRLHPHGWKLLQRELQYC